MRAAEQLEIRLEYILTHFHRLEVLDVGKTKIEQTGLIGDEGVKAIARGCRNLRR